MNRRIGGLLDYSKLMPAKPAAASAESDQIPVQEHRPPAAALAYDEQARHDFALLPFDQQQIAVRRLAASGAGDHTIAQATGLNVNYVRQLLSPTYEETSR